jgi:streptogramin lyase
MPVRARAFCAAVGALALLAACTATGSGVGSNPSGGSPAAGLPASSASPTPAQTTPAPLPALENLPSSDVALGGAPGAVLWAHGAIWVMGHRNTTLYRVDPTDLTVSGTLDTGVLGCGDIVDGAGSLWVSGCSATPGLVRVDPRRLRVESTHIELNGLGPDFHRGQLWIAAGSGGVFGLRRGDPERLDEAHPVPVVGLGLDGGVVTSAGSVWVAEDEAVVYRVDPQTDQVTAAVPLPLDPGQPYLLTHDGAPWYIDHSLGAVARVDPATNTPAVLSLRPVRPPEYRGVAASSAPGRPAELWVRSGSDEAWLIDTRRDRVIRRVAIADGGGGDLEEVDGVLWVAHFGLDTLQRIDLG